MSGTAGRPRPAYVVCHPGLARQVLTDFRLFDRTGLVYARIRTAMGNGLASAAHQDHRRQRLIMQPALSLTCKYVSLEPGICALAGVLAGP